MQKFFIKEITDIEQKLQDTEKDFKKEKRLKLKNSRKRIFCCINVYMTDRFLPDKAIDALDEAGSRVHISNIVVPIYLLDQHKLSFLLINVNQII